MAEKFKQRPSQILFPKRKNPLWMLAVDNLVYEIGYEEELRADLEIRKAEIGRETQMFEFLMKFLDRRL